MQLLLLACKTGGSGQAELVLQYFTLFLDASKLAGQDDSVNQVSVSHRMPRAHKYAYAWGPSCASRNASQLVPELLLLLPAGT